jgi:hypothetical protein
MTHIKARRLVKHCFSQLREAVMLARVCVTILFLIAALDVFSAIASLASLNWTVN